MEDGPAFVCADHGGVHAGHISLFELARKYGGSVAVSIFVNPTQFGPREDYNRYPRPVEADLASCEKAGVELVFLPEAAEIYPPAAADVVIDLPQLHDDAGGETSARALPGRVPGGGEVVQHRPA